MDIDYIYGELSPKAREFLNGFSGQITLYFEKGFLVYPNGEQIELLNTSLVNKFIVQPKDDVAVSAMDGDVSLNVMLRKFKLLTKTLFEKIQLCKNGVVFTHLEDSEGNALGSWTKEQIELVLKKTESLLR